MKTLTYMQLVASAPGFHTPHLDESCGGKVAPTQLSMTKATSSLSATSNCWNPWTLCILCHLPWPCLPDQSHVSFLLWNSPKSVYNATIRYKSELCDPLKLWSPWAFALARFEVLSKTPKCPRNWHPANPGRWLDESSPKLWCTCRVRLEGKTDRLSYCACFWCKLYGSISSEIQLDWADSEQNVHM